MRLIVPIGIAVFLIIVAIAVLSGCEGCDVSCSTPVNGETC